MAAIIWRFLHPDTAAITSRAKLVNTCDKSSGFDESRTKFDDRSTPRLLFTTIRSRQSVFTFRDTERSDRCLARQLHRAINRTVANSGRKSRHVRVRARGWIAEGRRESEKWWEDQRGKEGEIYPSYFSFYTSLLLSYFEM